MTVDQEGQARRELHAAYPDAAETLDRYVDILASRGVEWGLLGPREGDRLWSRHIANSLSLADVIGQGIRVADIGSGAGLPGIPLAIARPDLDVTLVEPLLRRSTFLTQAVDELGLEGRVDVVRSRSEDLKDQFDIVTCRAVASLDKLLKWTSRLFTPGGTLIALKGESAEDEIRAAGSQLARMGLSATVLELRVAPGVEPTRAIRVS